jgi:hypothetical protein
LNQLDPDKKKKMFLKFYAQLAMYTSLTKEARMNRKVARRQSRQGTPVQTPKAKGEAQSFGLFTP